MRKNFLFFFLIFSFAASGAQTIFIKKENITFNTHYDFFLDEGKVFYRPRNALDKTWEKIPENIFSDEPIRHITADGDNLFMVGMSDRLYYAKMKEPDLFWKWNKAWGMFKRKPLFISSSMKFVSASHALKEGYYVDAAGKIHSNILGITTIFALDSLHNVIAYSDPAFKSKFANVILPPYNEQTKTYEVISSLTASSSWMAIVTKSCRIFAIMKDFDKGENIFMRMSYVEKGEEDSWDGVPEESEVIPQGILHSAFKRHWMPFAMWREISSPFQNCHDFSGAMTLDSLGLNGSRDIELRLEGIYGDDKGFYYKKIVDKNWNFFNYRTKKISSIADSIRSTSKTDADSEEEALKFTRIIEEKYIFGEFVGSLKNSKHRLEFRFPRFSPNEIPLKLELTLDGVRIPADFFMDVKFKEVPLVKMAKGTLRIDPIFWSNSYSSKQQKAFCQLIPCKKKKNQQRKSVWTFMVVIPKNNKKMILIRPQHKISFTIDRIETSSP